MSCNPTEKSTFQPSPTSEKIPMYQLVLAKRYIISLWCNTLMDKNNINEVQPTDEVTEEALCWFVSQEKPQGQMLTTKQGPQEGANISP